MSLISKLNEKFKNIKDNTKKRVMATILAGGIALSGLGMAGCNPNSNNPDNTNPPITNPGDENTGNNNGGSQNPNYSKFSQILQNVINDRYYVDLLVTHEAWDGSDQTAPGYNNAKYNAIPYGFLEDEGYNISSIKNNFVKSQSDLYSIGNDLYIELRIETKATKNYYTNYLLKYSLTNQELSEIDLLFTQIGSGNKSTFIQAPLFVQELSYLKDPIVLAKANIAIDSLEKVESRADDKKFIANTTNATYLNGSVNEIPTTYHTYLIHEYLVNPTKRPSKGKMKIGQITFKTYGNLMQIINNNSVNCSGNPASLILTDTEKTNFESSIQTVNYYTAESAVLKNIFDYENEKSLLYDLVD